MLDDDTCRRTDCTETTDDGEGWDGFCGNCADIIDSHISEYDEDRHHMPRTDCAVCTGEVSEREATPA